VKGIEKTLTADAKARNPTRWGWKGPGALDPTTGEIRAMVGGWITPRANSIALRKRGGSLGPRSNPLCTRRPSTGGSRRRTCSTTFRSVTRFAERTDGGLAA